MTDNDDRLVQINIEETIKHFGGTYVGEFSLMKHETVPCALFYQKEIPTEVYSKVKNPDDVSNYYVVYFNPFDGTLRIANGLDVASRTRAGIVLPSGELIWSRHRHDYREVAGNMIDGGDSYTRYSLNGGALYPFIIKDGVISLALMADIPTELKESIV